MWRRHVEPLLPRYAEGDLAPEEAQSVARHLDRCRRCREAEREVRAGLRLAARLEPAALPPERASAIRAALLAGAPAASATGAPAAAGRLPSRRWLAAAAAVVLVAGLGAWLRARPAHLRVVTSDASASRLEAAALALHERHRSDQLELDLRTRSVVEARRWSQAHVALDASLASQRPEEDGDRYELEGVRAVDLGGTTALAVAYRVDGRPVTLLTARAGDLPDHGPIWGFGGKTVRYRAVRAGHKLLSWTNAGQAYTLVSDLPGYGQQACFVCHTNAARRQVITSMHPNQ
jgi:anti-sigma factor ChrR (cupin superfamily)